MSDKWITYSYPLLISLDEQIFFTDDTTWNLYNFTCNTRNLDKSIPPGARISILLSDNRIRWDTEYDTIQVKGEDLERIKSIVEFDEQSCYLIAADTIKANMVFEISGLRIEQVNEPDIKFHLKMSLDYGVTICATDFDSKQFKYVKPPTDYTGKIERALETKYFTLESGRNWKIRIPRTFPYEWDTGANSIEKILIREGIPKGNINFNSLSNKVTFPDTKTAKIAIRKGYGEISQGMQISGLSEKKLFFKGLKLKRSSRKTEMEEFNDYMELVVETPYGMMTIQSDKSGAPDWGLTINGKKSFIIDQLLGKELEVCISTPQVKNFVGSGVLPDEKLQLYSKEKERYLMLKPLVKNFSIDNKEKAIYSVLNSIRYIKGYYDDTDPKGHNWKVWYYLAWAKKRAHDLGILDQFLNNDLLKDDESLIRGSYDDDMTRALQRGYQPEGRHKIYPTILKGDLLAEINNKISIAENKFKNGDLLEAEQDFIQILAETKEDDSVKHLAALVNYWLGRIGILLDDLEYVKYRQSYPYRKFNEARIILMNNQMLFSESIGLEDSIIVYRNLVEERIKHHSFRDQPVTMHRQTTNKGETAYFQDNAYHFTYKYGNDYTFNIIGETGSMVGLLDLNKPETLLLSDQRLTLRFDDKILLTKGGDYSVEFSPKKQNVINLIYSIIIMGVVFLYA